MNIKDHIGIFDKGLPLNVCEAVIQSFNLWEEQKEFIGDAFKKGDDQFKDGQLSRSDTQLCLEVVDLELFKTLNGFIRKAFEEYTTVYGGILQNNDPVSTWTTKVQKTTAGGGYHQWHCENGQFLYRDRVLAWMIYLNTIPAENGGGTDFLHQKLTLQPEAGTIVLWPASYTHMHRGGFLTGDINKYIATGWFLREPRQNTQNLL